MIFAWDCVFQVRVPKMKLPWDYIWLLIHLTGTFDIEYKLSFSKVNFWHRFPPIFDGRGSNYRIF